VKADGYPNPEKRRRRPEVEPQLVQDGKIAKALHYHLGPGLSGIARSVCSGEVARAPVDSTKVKATLIGVDNQAVIKAYASPICSAIHLEM